MNISFKLAWHELLNGWKHFRVFLSCLVLGVFVMATVNIIESVVKNALTSQAKSLMGGDFEVKLKGVDATEAQINYLQKKYGKTSKASTLRAMLQAGDDDSLLVEVKAVDKNYPLIGDLLIKAEGVNVISKKDALSKNGVIVDQILLSQLGLKVGSKVRVGNSDFIIKAVLEQEPDRVLQIFSFGPRVMMSQESLVKSGLVNTFSLIENNYRVQLNKPFEINQKIEDKIEAELLTKFPETSWRVRSGNDSNRGVKRFLDQLIIFLSLSALTTFLIAGIGIASSIKAYLEKKYNTIAVLKILGSNRKSIFQSFCILLFLLSLIGGVIGVLFAVIATSLLIPLISEFLPSLKDVTSFDMVSNLISIWYGVLISFIFSIPALITALDVKPSVLFRSKFNSLNIKKTGCIIFIVTVLVLLLFSTIIFTADDIPFMVAAISIITLALICFAILINIIKWLSIKFKPKKLWFKYAVSNINRQGSTSSTVVFAIGVSLTIFITLNLTEQNLQKRIEKIVDEKAPSLFMIDIQPEQKEGLKKLMQNYANEKEIMFMPMMRARVTKINNKPVSEAKIDKDIDWVFKSDRGITYSQKMPENANIVQGQWRDKYYTGMPLISVDERILSGTNTKIGDTLTLNILGEEITAKIANARVIDYTSFQINFAMVLSHGVVDDFPHSAISTVYINNEDDEANLVRAISKQFPQVTIIRTKEVIDIVKDILEKVLVALNVTILISLFSGLLVLFSALSSTINQRVYDTAMLKIMGARKNEVIKACLYEWGILAFGASIIAIIIGSFSAYLISLKYRATEFYLMPELTITTIIATIIIICLIGYYSNRKLFSSRPSVVLRND